MEASSRPLNRQEASAYLLEKHGIRLTPGTLAKLASTGGGPAYRKVRQGVLYDPPVLDRFAAGSTTAPAVSYAQHVAQAKTATAKTLIKPRGGRRPAASSATRAVAKAT